LPSDWQCGEAGSIQIPRESNRVRQAEDGLFSKIEFTSTMSENQIKIEICCAFMLPMGICEDKLAVGNTFHLLIYKEQEQDPIVCECQLYLRIFNGMEDKLLAYARMVATRTS